MADAVVWVHDYAMRANSPAFREAGVDGAHGVFVFDDEWIAQERLSVKRLVFLYECALEMGVEVRRGDVVGAVVDFARERGASRVVTVESVSPRIRKQVEAMRRSIRVDVVPEDPFVDLGGRDPDLKRFSRYWSKAERRVFAQANAESTGRLFPDRAAD